MELSKQLGQKSPLGIYVLMPLRLLTLFLYPLYTFSNSREVTIVKQQTFVLLMFQFLETLLYFPQGFEQTDAGQWSV